MSDARKGRSRRARIVLVVFRLAMAVVIVLFAWRTYEEMAIANARSSGNLEPADATVVDVTEDRNESLGGAGQDRTSETFVWYEVTFELRVNGELQSVKGGGDRVLNVGDHARVGLWHGYVVELEGYYVWRGWHSGLGGNTLLVFYPLAMGYLITLAVAARIRMAGLRGVDDNFVFDIVLGFIVGMATILPLALVPAALGTDHPRFWPLIPVATGTTAALLLMRRQLRRRQSKATRAETDDTDAEGSPARP
ncbi:hypothetical protein [Streptomyces sp. NBC_01235]|uniref:hypothetical protein n=1 Tax=Streptomyces sp. NBC_01235 TaxID=2903788 RepID=UPI002E10F71A|nr:hypothetical protein OG289_48185 [Streptomyces sp. NBC_01235]